MKMSLNSFKNELDKFIQDQVLGGIREGSKKDGCYEIPFDAFWEASESISTSLREIYSEWDGVPKPIKEALRHKTYKSWALRLDMKFNVISIITYSMFFALLSIAMGNIYIAVAQSSVILFVVISNIYLFISTYRKMNRTNDEEER